MRNVCCISQYTKVWGSKSVYASLGEGVFKFICITRDLLLMLLYIPILGVYYGRVGGGYI